MHRLHLLANRYLLALLLGAYAVAAFYPGLGLWVRELHFGSATWVDGSHASFTLSTILLSVLLLNAGLGIKVRELRGIIRRPSVLGIGVVANVVVPLSIVLGLHSVLGRWHNASEAQSIVSSLALIVSMPIAGSSTAWAQNSSGNLALSLGLVVLSTLISPLSTHLTLSAISSMEGGAVSATLHRLSNESIGAFLVYVVALPSLVGIAMHSIIGEKRAAAMKDVLKVVNIGILLVLNYSNAATSLPTVLASPDWDFLGLALAITTLLCGLCFASGWLVSTALRTNRDSSISMMFGLGMNNNGSALVVASAAFGNQPMILIPIIVYNLVQHVAAGVVNRMVSRTLPEIADGMPIDDPGLVEGREGKHFMAVPSATATDR